MAVQIVPYVEGVSRPPNTDLTGELFGMWIVVEFAGTSTTRMAYWKCRCQCGTERTVQQCSLRTGGSVCCGCNKVELWKKRPPRVQNAEKATIQPYVEGTSRPPKTDLTGREFGMWTVVAFAGASAGYKSHWQCKCECGTERTVGQANLLRGGSTNCGCDKMEKLRQRATKHSLSGTAEYHPWHTMIQRCHNPDATGYPSYGAKGITVCQRWRDSVAAFIADMGSRPSSKHTIDRYPDKNGNYEPGNCRWATRKEQNNNKENNRPMEEYKGEYKTLSGWAEHTGVPYDLLYGRVAKGWSMKDAIEKPLGYRHAKT